MSNEKSQILEFGPISERKPGLKPPTHQEIGNFLDHMAEAGVGQTTETVDSKLKDIDTKPNAEILDAFTEVQARAVAAVHKASPDIEKAAEAMIARLGDKGRIIYVGAGTSGRLGAVDGMELGPTFDFDDSRVGIGMVEEHEFKLGTSRDGREDHLWRAEQKVEEFKLTPNDAVICLAASGATPYTRRFAQLARLKGALVIGIANNYGAPLLEQDTAKIQAINSQNEDKYGTTLHAEGNSVTKTRIMVANKPLLGHIITTPDVDIPILLETGAEAIAGSSRMGAGTAQKIALTELTSLVMAKLPGTYGLYKGRMPNMRDANDKLVRRNTDMVAFFAEVALPKAREAVKKAMAFFVNKDGKRQDTITKEATLIALGASEEEAKDLMTSTKRNLRDAVKMQKARTRTGYANDDLKSTPVMPATEVQPAKDRNAGNPRSRA